MMILVAFGVAGRSALRTLTRVLRTMWPRQIGETTIRAEVFLTEE